MKRILTSILALIAITSAVFAQNDSIAFAHGAWKEAKIEEGVILRQCHFANKEIFNANEYVSVLIISPKKAINVAQATPGKLEKTTAIAERNEAVAAVNGSFFFMKEPFGPTTYVRINGRYCGVGDNALPGRIRDRFEDGCLVIRGKKARVLKAESRDITWEDGIKADDILSSGPMLLEKGTCSIVEDAKFNSKRHPRTAVGIRPDGTKVLVTVDGRTAASQGASIPEMQDIMHWLGCVDALNLDGGGSTAMVVNGTIVNHPCDNKKFDAAGERSVANAIIIR